MIRKKHAYNIIVFLAFGIGLGLFVKYIGRLTFNFEVSVFDSFALCVTAALAWWVAEKLEKDSEKERYEKDIIIEKIRAMDGLVEKLNNKIEGDDPISLTAVNSIFNSVDTISNRIVEILKTSYPSVYKNHLEWDYISELNRLDELCTDDTDGGINFYISDGLSVCTYSPERIEDIGACSNLFSDKLFNLEILVNRA